MGILPIAVGLYLISSSGKKPQGKKGAASSAWPQAKKFAGATPQGRAASFGARMASKLRRGK